MLVLDYKTGSSAPPEEIFAVTTLVAFVSADVIGLVLYHQLECLCFVTFPSWTSLTLIDSISSSGGETTSSIGMPSANDSQLFALNIFGGKTGAATKAGALGWTGDIPNLASRDSFQACCKSSPVRRSTLWTLCRSSVLRHLSLICVPKLTRTKTLRNVSKPSLDRDLSFLGRTILVIFNVKIWNRVIVKSNNNTFYLSW